MNQETINKAYRALGEFAEILSGELRKEANKMESSEDKKDFIKAQKIKECANLLESNADGMKKKYPHLFKNKKVSQ